jgi:hypothetical protein
MQQALTVEDPATFFRPPYVGHKGWVGARIDGRRDWKAIASVVRDAHRFVAAATPRKQARVPQRKRGSTLV